MTALPEREAIVVLIDEAVSAGARRAQACWHAGIDARTYRRWRGGGENAVCSDARPEAVRPMPSNRLSEAEREAILLTCHLPRFADLPPSQIVPTLADEGVYLGSESSFYRLLHENAEQVERGRTTPYEPGAHDAQGHRAESGLDMGRYLPEHAGARLVLLPVHGNRHLQPQDRRLGSARNGDR